MRVVAHALAIRFREGGSRSLSGQKSSFEATKKRLLQLRTLMQTILEGASLNI